MALNSGKILMRRGQEVNFDPNKMTPGEWAVSLDNKYVRMCFAPGVCVRMATYDAFEADMEQIRQILAECQTVEEAVTRINDEISIKEQAVAEYAAQAKQYRDEAEQFRNQAFSSTPEGYLELVEQVEENTRKIEEGVGGVSDYEDLDNKPKINDVELSGNKTIEDLGGLEEESLIEFSEASTRENIAATDSIKNIFGKVKKWFADLKPHAFSNPTNNLLATEAGTALDAVQGKVLYEKIKSVNVSRNNLRQYNTLEEFVTDTATDITIPHYFRFKDLSGFVLGKANSWYRILLCYQNPYSETTSNSLGGTGLLWDSGNVYRVFIGGTKTTGVSLTLEKLVAETDIANVLFKNAVSSWKSQITVKTTGTSGALAILITQKGLFVFSSSSSSLHYSVYNFNNSSFSSNTPIDFTFTRDTSNSLIGTLDFNNNNVVCCLLPLIGKWEVISN